MCGIYTMLGVGSMIGGFLWGAGGKACERCGHDRDDYQIRLVGTRASRLGPVHIRPLLDHLLDSSSPTAIVTFLISRFHRKQFRPLRSDMRTQTNLL